MTIFGAIETQSALSGNMTFILVIFMVVVMEAFLEHIEHVCRKHQLDGLFKKLYKEFMIMGLISFTIFIMQTSIDLHSSEWFYAFELAHIIIVFIGLAFLLQACLFIYLITSQRRELKNYSKYQATDLFINYIYTHAAGGLKRYMFDYAPRASNYPKLIQAIEYKFIRDFVLQIYNLPENFAFSDYMTETLQNYILDFIDAKPIIWFTLILLTLLNYAKIVLIDHVKTTVCNEGPGDAYDPYDPYDPKDDDLKDPNNRRLEEGAPEGGAASNSCREYLLDYAVAAVYSLNQNPNQNQNQNQNPNPNPNTGTSDPVPLHRLRGVLQSAH